MTSGRDALLVAAGAAGGAIVGAAGCWALGRWKAWKVRRKLKLRLRPPKQPQRPQEKPAEPRKVTASVRFK